VFLAGWLRTPYALAGCAVLIAALVSALRRGGFAWRAPQGASLLLLLAAAGFAWAAFGGAGHLAYANRHDWIVRDALLADLVFTDWPPAYGGSGAEPAILRTALGYFLPAALLGKWLGVAAAHLALYAWTGLGAALFLLLLPMPQRIGARLAVATAVVVLFSGMDIVGQVLEKGWPKPAEHIEWWSGPFQYSSLSTQLFWVPNHALPAWIAMALLYRHWQRAQAYPTTLLASALLVAWTPFAAIGIAPFVALQVAQRLRGGLGILPGPAVLACMAMLGYLFGRLYSLDLSELPLEANLPAPTQALGFFARYVEFTLFEFALLGMALVVLIRPGAPAFWLALAVLAALPLARFGPSNDLMLRSSIPALAVLLIFVLHAVQAVPARQALAPQALLLWTILGIGAFTPAMEFWRAAALPAWQPSHQVSIVDIARGGAIPNYFGKLDRADLKALLRPATQVRAR
jgi:hypothetical protein